MVKGALVAISPMPTARESFGACVAGQFIFTAGGLQEDQKISSVVQAYNIVKNEWSSLADLPTPCHGLSLAVWNSAYLLAVGGQDATHQRMK